MSAEPLNLLNTISHILMDPFQSEESLTLLEAVRFQLE